MRGARQPGDFAPALKLRPCEWQEFRRLVLGFWQRSIHALPSIFHGQEIYRCRYWTR